MKLTKEQAVVISAYTGIMCASSFLDVHEYIEKILERPVFTHELGSEVVFEEIKEKSRPDFLELCYDGK